MAKNEKIFTKGIIPIDLSENEAWLGGQMTYELGVCTFKVTGYTSGQQGKKQIGWVHELLAGPEGKGDGMMNKGKTMTRIFALDKKETKNFLKGYVEAVGGKAAFVGGKPNADMLVGAIFKANIFSREAEVPDKKDPTKRVVRTFFEFDMNTIEVLERPKAAESAQDGAPDPSVFAPQ